MATKAEKKTGRKPENLNPMELSFCEQYALVGSETYSNGAASAEKAGYAAKSAHTSAWKLLRRDVIREKIQEIHAEQMSRLYLTADKVLSDLEHTRLAAFAKNDLAVATRCSELQAKYLGLLVDRQRFELEPERRELSEREQVECREIARLRLDAIIAGERAELSPGFSLALQAENEGEKGPEDDRLTPQAAGGLDSNRLPSHIT